MHCNTGSHAILVPFPLFLLSPHKQARCRIRLRMSLMEIHTFETGLVWPTPSAAQDGLGVIPGGLYGLPEGNSSHDQWLRVTAAP